MNKIGNGSIPLRIGNLINTRVYGGPYHDVPIGFFGIKMAEEITHPHMVDIPTRDFGVPKVSDLRAGIIKTFMAIINEEIIYVGCMGGIGRTGIFLAALAKVQIEYRKLKHRAGRGEDPVLYVRHYFLPHAVETQQQMEYIERFDVSDIVAWLDATQVAMGKNIGYQKATANLYHPESVARDVDANCVSLPDGSCIAEDPCMHDNHKAGWKQYYRERVSQFADEGQPYLPKKKRWYEKLMS